MIRINHDKATVLVTGVGAIIGQGIVRSLRSSTFDVRIVGLDRSDRQPGPAWCDRFIRKPDCAEDSSDYLRFWAEMLREAGIQLVLPGLEVDLDFLDRHRKLQELAPGCVFSLNHASLIALSKDKWCLHNALIEHGLPTIPTLLPCEWKEAINAFGSAPILLKPRCNNGSRGIVRLDDATDLAYWERKTSEPWMLQKIVGNAREEYTVGTFGFGDGTALDPIIMRRRLAATGNTIEAEVVQQEAIRFSVESLNRIFKPLGPTNFQYRIENGQPLLLEINPRFSSSNSLRTQFGYNEAELAFEYFLRGTRPAQPSVRCGKGWRFTEDFVQHDCPAI